MKKSLHQGHPVLQIYQLLVSQFCNILFNRSTSISSLLFDFFFRASNSQQSHMITTFHPNCSHFFSLRLSRSMDERTRSVIPSDALCILSPNLQSLWPCQKQPLTSTIVLYLFITISGLPGNFLSCNR